MTRWMKRALAGLAGTTALIGSAPTLAQSPFLGDIILVPYNFCPRGYDEAEGQLLSIAQNSALFSLYGTTYGGDGVTTFALPDLRGRFSISQGQGPGLSNYVEGQRAGAETVTLTIANLPAHDHGGLGQLRIAPVIGNSMSPVGNFPSKTNASDPAYHTDDPGNYASAGSVEVGVQGGSQPFDIRPPYLTLRHCVALEGIFPSQN